jgi:hypothetical protein
MYSMSRWTWKASAESRCDGLHHSPTGPDVDALFLALQFKWQENMTLLAARRGGEERQKPMSNI